MLSLALHNILSIQLTPLEEFPANELRPAFWVRYLVITTSDDQHRIPLFADRPDALHLLTAGELAAVANCTWSAEDIQRQEG
jgi:hypothetical protein